jgi:hypothetical protein
MKVLRAISLLAVLFCACTIRVYVRASQPVRVDTVYERGCIDPGLNPWEGYHDGTQFDPNWHPWPLYIQPDTTCPENPYHLGEGPRIELLRRMVRQ